MRQKTFYIRHLGCANCAAKMETKINALPQVQEAVITFATGQLRVSAEDPEALFEKMAEIIRGIEPDARLEREKEHGVHPHGCGCGHHDHEHSCGHGHGHCGCGHDHAHEHEHHHEHGHAHDHDREDKLWPLLAGGGLFVLGLILGAVSEIRWMSGAAFVAAYLVLGWQVLTTAGKNLIRGHVFDENFLMSLATLGAFAIGEFPEAVGVMLFYRVGEFFEHKAVAHSRSRVMEAADLRPETVLLVEASGTRTVPAAQVRVGELVQVRPGDRVPLDGTVVSGESLVDTAPITGEPVPVEVAEGDSVTSGCVNGGGQLVVRVEKPLSESMVSRILDAVENAAARKPKIDRFITRFARVYTPAVVAAAVLTAVVPSLIDGRWSYWVYTALSFLVMSCPCALVLSIPLAFFSGIGAGSRKGILFKGGASMEAMAKVRHVLMDKTGTLTGGTFRVLRVHGPEEVLGLCASCEQGSGHPIAVSIVSEAKARGVALAEPAGLEEISGHGIRAELDGRQVLCGNKRLLERFGVKVGEDHPEGTCVYVAVDGAYLGCITVGDALKEDATEAVRQLRAMGRDVAMLTGDSEAGAAPVADELGIDAHWGLLPGEKLEQMERLREQGGSVMFVGDGINDAPVLAGADVGGAMGSGADAAVEAADVVYLTNQVTAIPESLKLAERTQRVAWQNVIFALGVKAVVMVLGLLGCASMWLAVFADSGVAMLCVLNSVRLLHRRRIDN